MQLAYGVIADLGLNDGYRSAGGVYYGVTFSDVHVLVLGSLNADHVVHVTRLPAAGETLIADSYDIRPGGKGLNQAVAVARLGGGAALIGATGRDADAVALRGYLEDQGVDITGVITGPDQSSTGLAFITVDSGGENTIVVHNGANAFAPRLPAELLTDGRHTVLLCSLEVPLTVVADATERARAAGLLTVVNAAPMRGLADGTFQAVLDHTDVVIVNESEACQLVGIPAGDPQELARHLVSWRSENSAVVLTMGAEGALVIGVEGPRRVAAPVVAATSTVGAGDTFAAMLALALASGQSLEEAASLACMAGAIAVSRPAELSVQAVLAMAGRRGNQPAR